MQIRVCSTVLIAQYGCVLQLYVLQLTILEWACVISFLSAVCKDTSTTENLRLHLISLAHTKPQCI